MNKIALRSIMSKNDTNDFVAAIDPGKFRVAGVLYGILAQSALVTNCLIVVSHAKSPQLRAKHHFTPALALVDMLLWLSGFIRIMTPYLPPYSVPLSLCAILDIPMLFNCVCGPIYTLLLALYRLVGYKYPLYFIKIVQKRVVIGTHTAILLFGAVLSTSMAVTGQIDHEFVPICVLVFAVKGTTAAVAQATALFAAIGVVVVNYMLHKCMKAKAKTSGRLVESDKSAVRDARMAQSISMISLCDLRCNMAYDCGRIHCEQEPPQPSEGN